MKLLSILMLLALVKHADLAEKSVVKKTATQMLTQIFSAQMMSLDMSGDCMQAWYVDQDHDESKGPACERIIFKKKCSDHSSRQVSVGKNTKSKFKVDYSTMTFDSSTNEFIAPAGWITKVFKIKTNGVLIKKVRWYFHFDEDKNQMVLQETVDFIKDGEPDSAIKMIPLYKKMHNTNKSDDYSKIMEALPPTVAQATLCGILGDPANKDIYEC